MEMAARKFPCKLQAKLLKILCIHTYLFSELRKITVNRLHRRIHQSIR